ncbi:hypothetical protein N7462_001406 [Penicillium macrosclerotiorum]|uniref:uncharacterized protein n=1 Tax=Penicillium macrosclerotiorum TaxID=303699 RepID=UPI0025491936|nr:uncharacterized protein N7462_001406 [Penicillium macrosclerotiorum]KAJ5691983.1 hypothetical protein N7462_001406 [Penicillium macrosclerotiorum]
MPRAEAGSVKAIGNKIKSKGLQRLRFYCQACEKQCRDQNALKQHCLSESHVRQMLLISEDPKSHIRKYSEEFKTNFVNLLKTTHGEKKVHINHFYQQVIADKTHIHMNATEWKSLTQFAAYLGKEGICRVEETEKGLFVSWIDNSPETLRKREAVMRKERQDKGDEEREQQQIQEQIERAQLSAASVTKEKDDNLEDRMLPQEDGEKVKLNFGFGSKPNADAKPGLPSAAEDSAPNDSSAPTPTDASTPADASPAPSASQAPAKISMSFGGQKPKNVFASAGKKNPLAGKKGPVLAPQKKISEQERIMKAEMEAMERKRSRPDSGFNAKRPKLT